MKLQPRHKCGGAGLISKWKLHSVAKKKVLAIRVAWFIRYTQNCTAINKEKAVGILNGMLTVKMLGLGFGRNGRQVTEVIIFTSVGDGFEVFGISVVGDANTCDLTLLCHIYRLLFLNDGVVGKLIPGDPAAFFYKTDDPLGVGIRLRDLIQGLLCKFLPKVVIVHIHRSFEIVFASQ